MSLLSAGYTPNPGDVVRQITGNANPMSVVSTLTEGGTQQAICTWTQEGNQVKTSTFALGSLDFSELGVSSAVVVKPSTGTLVSITVIAVGTAGSLTLNDSATVGGASGGNQISTTAFGSLTAGQVIAVNHLCSSGIVISAVPTGGIVRVTYV